jgi:hypothetical protein
MRTQRLARAIGSQLSPRAPRISVPRHQRKPLCFQADVTDALFCQSTLLSVASPFNMPAMSPTMTEGNIATWKVKEGIVSREN